MSQFCMRSRSADSRNGRISFTKQRFITKALFEEQIYNMFCHYTTSLSNSSDCRFPKFFSQKRLIYPFDESEEFRKLDDCLKNFKLPMSSFRTRFSKNLKYQVFYFGKAFFEKKRFIIALKNFKRQETLFYDEASLVNSRVILRFKKQQKNKEWYRTQLKVGELSHKNPSFNGVENEKSSSVLSRSSKVPAPRRGESLSEVKIIIDSRTANFRESFLQDSSNPKLKRFSELIFTSYKAKMTEQKPPNSVKKSTLCKKSSSRNSAVTSKLRSRFMLSQDKDRIYMTSKSNKYEIKKKSILNMLKSNYTTGEKIPMRPSVTFRRALNHNFLNNPIR